jgi:CheY-like chemotaxis protein
MTLLGQRWSLRPRNPIRALPIILCTEDTPTGSAAQAAPQGIDAVLAKPFFPVELAYTVEKVLAAHHGANTP